jgi:Tetratricopeptide repeat
MDQRRLSKCLSVIAAGLGLLAISPGLTSSMTSQDLPAQDLASPVAAPSPGASPASSPSPGGWQQIPAQSASSPVASPVATPANGPETESAGAPTDSDAVPSTQQTIPSESPQPAGQPSATSSPLPPLDVSSFTPGPDLGNSSLDPEINKAIVPARTASLGLTEQARKELGAGQLDDALRGLARAVSIDPSNPFAYYYLGRAYLLKANYEQALTFFKQAEIWFTGRPEWIGETAGYEGACYEELGRTSDAIQAYQRALAAAPNNLMARVGYGRLASVAGPVGPLDAAPPLQASPPPAPGAEPEAAPSEEAPPPPPEN